MKLSGTLMRLLAAVMIALSGYIHYHMWETGYRAIPIIGPMFMLDIVASVLICTALIVTNKLPMVLIGIGLEAGAIISLGLSSTVGLFGFRESGMGISNYVMGAYVSEAAAVALLVGYLALNHSLKGRFSSKSKLAAHSS